MEIKRAQQLALIIDDEQVRIKNLYLACKENSLLCLKARNAFSGCLLIQRHRPDIIFLDYDLDDNSEWVSGRLVADFLIRGSKLQESHNYHPYIVIHSENEDGQIELETILKENGFKTRLEPFYFIANRLTRVIGEIIQETKNNV